jgi:hypothetical protein
MEAGLRSRQNKTVNRSVGSFMTVRNCKETRKQRLWEERRHWKLLCLEAGKRNDAGTGKRRRKRKTGRKRRKKF